MIKTTWMATALLGTLLPPVAIAQESSPVATKYQALKCPAATLGTTWAILQRDGANRPTEPYLSSLGQGEGGTGVVTSPPFQIAGQSITFTVRGHDGQTGGRGENYLALVDARKGTTLHKTMAPGGDALAQRSWDVSKLGGRQVRIEIHDGNSGGAFAWLGVEQIDASPAMKVDFRQGIPDGWLRPQRKADVRHQTLTGGIPFRRNANVFTWIPNSGSVEIPCGFAAERLFFLGCTIGGGNVLKTYGGIEIHYRTGSPEVFPLIHGFTLDAEHKLLSRSMALFLHPTSDPFQHYLAIAPRAEVIEKIRLVAAPDRGPIPRITAITCKTAARSDRLIALPDATLSPLETEWIHAHTISSGHPELGRIIEVIRKDHKLPSAAATSTIRFKRHQLDKKFRSEGVAVADFNGDGRLDVAAGNVYYAGPDWKIVPMLAEPQEFNRYGYSDAFLCFADDLDGDGPIDLIVVGFPGQKTHWLQNPGKAGGVWKKHLAVAQTGNESPMYLDVDGDGRKELLCINGGRCVLARPGEDPTRPWTMRAISGPGDPAPGHGLGVGDINGDGRRDVLVPNGWWEGPADSSRAPWRFHKAGFFGGAQLCVEDFDGDGDSDVLGSSAHGYGISWCEQTPQGWQIHEIDRDHSQTHALHLADVGGNGLTDFITGKRFWAHNGHDPGSFQPAVLCWFRQIRLNGRPRWLKYPIDVDSGVGLHFQIVDLDGDRLLDVVTSSKKGVYYFQQVRN